MNVGSNSKNRIVCFGCSEVDFIVLIPALDSENMLVFGTYEFCVNDVDQKSRHPAVIYDMTNFINKKPTTLHNYLYNTVKVICLESKSEVDWVCCGFTYFILKGNPQRGFYYRQIYVFPNSKSSRQNGNEFFSTLWQNKFQNFCLEVNLDKSDTIDRYWKVTAILLQNVSVYKFLEIEEDNRGNPTLSSFKEVRFKLISRVERLCRTN
ncbi:hypothetical protein CWI36_0681p0010 [Hamiltosporidium magnivora]|uniref:Uncharacterized protein n=1 Tax=Hamiltosporidium magnivora TaxID=148818 RepID=A0A4Q9LB92_9MICR|nr:hypothetical protein CWI36_0681p0010 [Hamiltosporidium magnivora]